jgi:hypothetical protein
VLISREECHCWEKTHIGSLLASDRHKTRNQMFSTRGSPVAINSQYYYRIWDPVLITVDREFGASTKVFSSMSAAHLYR